MQVNNFIPTIETLGKRLIITMLIDDNDTFKNNLGVYRFWVIKK